MDSDEIARELARVWERVVSAPAPGPLPSDPGGPFIPADGPSITREASLEAIALIKRQSRGESGRMAQVLELKERTLAELRARLDAAEGELAAARRRALREDELVYDRIQAVSLELEAAREAVQSQQRSFREEEALLRAVAEETRRQLAAEGARYRGLEKEWLEREQSLLMEMAELRASAERCRKESALSEGQAARAAADLASAKEAVEAALAELLRERQERGRSEEDRDRALERLKELETRMSDFNALWEEERRQWREVLEREKRGGGPGTPPQQPSGAPSPPLIERLKGLFSRAFGRAR